MKEIKPNFLKGSQLNPSYYEQPNPYVNAPSCHINLLELSRYAKKTKKSLLLCLQKKLIILRYILICKKFQSNIYNRRTSKRESLGIGFFFIAIICNIFGIRFFFNTVLYIGNVRSFERNPILF